MLEEVGSLVISRIVSIKALDQQFPNLWVERPLEVEQPFHRGHPRPSEKLQFITNRSAGM